MKQTEFFPPSSGPLAAMGRPIAMLRPEPAELAKASGIHFKSGHDDLDELEWAEIVSPNGNRYALVRHRNAPKPGTEIVVSSDSSSPASDLEDVLALLGITQGDLLWSHPDAQRHTEIRRVGSGHTSAVGPSGYLKDSRLRASAPIISRFKKERFLQSLSEDEFRDKVVRPLFQRLGLRNGRDFCGPLEEGKDAVFLAADPLGGDDIVVVQTKKGHLNLASKARDNLINAVVQLRTAAETPVFFSAKKTKQLPSKVILCTSGKINPAARKYIVDEVRSPQLRFSDSDDLIPQIDEHYPELWLDIDAEVLPYMRALRRAIEDTSDNLAITELIPGVQAAATDSMFVDLHLWRNVLKTQRRRGEVEKIPTFIELPVTGILGKPERLVLILGEAGAGKSTAIRRLAYVLAGRAITADTDPIVPILLRATDLAKSLSLPLLDVALAESQKISGSTKPAFGNDDLQNGRVVILIDGLDEVAVDSERKQLLEGVLAFQATYVKCLVVVTSREYAFLRNLAQLGEFARYRVQSISIREAQQLVEKLERKGNLPLENSKELVRRLENIHGMDLNPLLVTVFAATTEHARQDIPANITELFKKFTEMMLGRWDATKGFGHQFHAPLKDFILSRIAFEMHFSRLTSMDLEEFRSRIATELENRGHQADIPQLLDEILNRSGLLRVVGNQVEFRHLLLQEFFAGRGIPSEDLLETFVFDDWWRRAVVFYFGERPGSSAGLARVRSIIRGHAASARFTAAGTLGLALQACYLIPITDKLAGIVEVMEHLAEVKADVIRDIPGIARFPIGGFLTYYLLGRDSVAFDVLESHAEPILERWRSEGLPGESHEAREFWLISGLLESGQVTKAERLIRKFKPQDPKLLLGIHLSCFLIQHLRVSTDEQRKSAARICTRLAPTVEGLRKQVFDEFKTHLLEMRKGEIAAIPESDEA